MSEGENRLRGQPFPQAWATKYLSTDSSAGHPWYVWKSVGGSVWRI